MSATRASQLRHVRPVQPLRFPTSEPESEHLGQSTRHLELCMALYRILRAAVAAEHTVGADQFVYFNAANPRRCLAPDAFVTLGRPQSHFESYKVWEEGTPELAFEVLSPSDTPERWTLKEKLRRYQELGIRELITFQVDAAAGERLRAWDRLEGDLVERIVEDERTPCLTLGLSLLLAAVPGHAIALRLARDVEGQDLVLLPEEAEARRRAEAEAAAEQEKARSAQAEAAAEQEKARSSQAEAAAAQALERVADLEAEIRRLREAGRR